MWQTVTTRSCFLPIFLLVLPPLVMKGLAMRAGPAAMLVESGVITLCLIFALPMALAIQPQTMSLEVSTLEPEFRQLTESDGVTPVTCVFASKGL